MTVEAQKSADNQLVPTGHQPAASMIEAPAVTVKKLIADKVKHHHAAKTELFFDTHKIFAGNAGVKAVPRQDLRQENKHLQNSVQPDRSSSPEQSKSKDAAPSSKPTDAASPTQAKDNKDPDRLLTPDQAMKEHHDQLVANAKANIHKPKELAKFQDDLTKLERRAKKDNVSSAQLAQMYTSVDTLITSTATTPSNQSQRWQLSEQIISQAADPMRIHQGNHNTCGAADLEVATYLKHPEAAARMVSDLALTGQYTAMDGSTVQVDPQAHNESKLPDDGYNRSHASEIFQVGALNIALKQDGKLDPDYVKDGKYWQSEDGEHVQIVRGDKTITDNVYPLNDFEIPFAYSAITGDKSLGTISQDDEFTKKETSDIVDVTRFKTEKDFDDYMAHAKMPVVVLINSDNEPFDEPAKLGDSEKYADRDNLGHYIVVTSYEAGPPPKATIYNTQGENFAFGKGGQITVHNLYQAMLNRPDTIKELQKDIADDKKHRRVDNEKSLELLRLEIESGTLSKKQAEREAKLILSHMSAAEKKNDEQTITNIYGALGISTVVVAPATTTN